MASYTERRSLESVSRQRPPIQASLNRTPAILKTRLDLADLPTPKSLDL